MSVFRIVDAGIGREILDDLKTIRERFDRLYAKRAMMIQSRSGDGTQAAHYAATGPLVGYRKADGTADDGAVAKASFEELDSFLQNCDDTLYQCVAKHVQA